MKKKFCICHFQPLERYPPVMNFINAATLFDALEISILTSGQKSSNWFFSSKARIYRILNLNSGKSSLYFSYFFYNFCGFVMLLIKRPSVILYFDTISVFPVYLYKKIFLSSKILVHYHEYVSPAEEKSFSLFMQLLRKMDNQLIKEVVVFSQTNEDRLRLFQNHKHIDGQNSTVLPNYPPNAWYKYCESYLSPCETKFVLLGAVSMTTMHFKVFVDWIIYHGSNTSLDIFSNNVEKEVIQYIEDAKPINIKILKPINYYSIPDMLKNYNVGVVLYNGSSDNFKYNVPNKIIEYYACGLKVLFSSDLISTLKFKEKYQLSSMISINFNELKELDLLLDKISFASIDKKIFNCEEVYKQYINNFILN